MRESPSTTASALGVAHGRAAFLLLASLWAAASFGDERTAKILKGLPACAPVAVKRAGQWKDVSTGRGFSLSLPACFQPDDKPEHRYMHGGNQWRCENHTASVVWGMWGQGSFGNLKLCSTTIGGVPAMVGTQEWDKAVSVLVWYLTGTVHEPALSAWSADRAGLPEIQAIVYSGRKVGVNDAPGRN